MASLPVPNDPAVQGCSRREVLMAALAAVSTTSIGCRQPADPLPPPVAPRTDVPLRVAFCGNEADREAIVQAWAAVNSQPLEMVLIDVDRAGNSGPVVDKLVAACQQSDLIIYPMLVTAELYSKDLLTPFTDDEFKLTQQQGGSFYRSLRNGVARYAGRYTVAPLGANQPALITRDAADEMTSWQDYDQWVMSLQGAAAEPLADGWAASMFLWRAASTIEQGWLFGRKDFEPLIDTEPYQRTLAQMRDTAQRYKIKRSTPREIWKALKSGSLKGALGFAFSDETSDAEFSFSDPPTEGLTRVVIDPYSPVGSLSTECRQSAASKQFLFWLAGGEGSETVRRQVSSMTSTRVSQTVSAGELLRASDGYERWLRQRLDTPSTLPTLQLLAAEQFYAVLDQQIIRCLEGETEPAATLAAVKESWQEIANRVGTKKQQMAWRRAQG